jgi:hypothetical protein
MNYKGQNFQGVSFKGHDLHNADFSGSDLRGADFTGANLSGADLSKTTTGLTKPVYAGIFFFSLIISLLSGYIAMLTGMTYQTLITSSDSLFNLSGYITISLFIIFVLLAAWKGGGFTIKIVFPVILLALIIGAILRLTGIGTGFGAFYGALAICLFTVMFYVGTIARASAGALASNILFLVVALGGGMFGKSLGGGLGTVAMALSCAFISKRALKGTKGFEFLRSVSLKVSTYFGTSFKNADLTNANFSNSTIKNTDFSLAKLDGVIWDNAKKLYNLNDAN